MPSSIVDIKNMGDAFRNTGYKNIESAAAEIVDNSVEANAKNVFVHALYLDKIIFQFQPGMGQSHIDMDLRRGSVQIGDLLFDHAQLCHTIAFFLMIRCIRSHAKTCSTNRTYAVDRYTLYNNYTKCLLRFQAKNGSDPRFDQALPCRISSSFSCLVSCLI